tara:strand:+ start:6613 stop:7662 length:1050 start_codon:yes stop_codon:yes gene_type:complete
MRTIIARNVNDALQQGISLMKIAAEQIPSRNGMTLEMDCPVATVYQNPHERVLINKVRDANPFFHLMEAMWIIAGRHDTKFLCEFNKRMADYADDGISFNAPYGFRLRNGVQTEWKDKHDQLEQIIDMLSKDPNSRQAVAQIWDDKDLMRQTKDKACNMSIVFRIRKNKLTMTVYNRSNDMIWGAYGANVVQFSMIQEYVAARLGLEMGSYTQVSNSYHVYIEDAGGEVWNRIKDQSITCENVYVKCDKLVLMNPDQAPHLNHDIHQFFNAYDQFGMEELGEFRNWKSDYFNQLIMPVLCVYLVHKQHGPKEALKYTDTIVADDWRLACEDWLSTRLENSLAKISKEAK